MKPLVAVLVALAVGAQAQTPEIDAERAGAERGEVLAQYALGRRYEDGRGVPQDGAEAVRWYRLVADQGYTDAHIRLAQMYSRGRGVPQDYVQAHVWYNLAASRRSGEDRQRSIRGRERAKSRMTPDQIAEAQRLAREWDAAHLREP